MHVSEDGRCGGEGQGGQAGHLVNLGVFSDDELGRFVDVKTLEVNGMELPGKQDHTIGNHSVELAKKK